MDNWDQLDEVVIQLLAIGTNPTLYKYHNFGSNYHSILYLDFGNIHVPLKLNSQEPL